MHRAASALIVAAILDSPRALNDVGILLDESLCPSDLRLATLILPPATDTGDLPPIPCGVTLSCDPDHLSAIKNLSLVFDLSGDRALPPMPGVTVLPPRISSWWLQEMTDALQRNIQSEQQARLMAEKAETYWNLFDNSVVGMYRTRIDNGKLIIGNRKLAELFEYPDYETLLREHNAATNYADPRKRSELFDLLKKDGRVDNFEALLKRTDGSVFWACLSAQLYPEKECLEGMILDIDARKKAEETNRNHSQRLLRAQEDERRRIARDLHDALGQALSTLQFGIDRLKTTLPAELIKHRDQCDKLATDVEDIGNTVRTISSYLRPGVLDHLGLVVAMESLIKTFRLRNNGMQIEMQVMGHKKRLADDIEIVLYRVLQEALTNIEKHSAARHVEILLTFCFPQVILIVRDDGRGFAQTDRTGPPAENESGIGLLGMSERLDYIGGALSVRSAPGRGTVVRAEITTASMGHSNGQDSCPGS
jgi:PAS domain S-box-containing protein